jgi:hypothetical protein
MQDVLRVAVGNGQHQLAEPVQDELFRKELPVVDLELRSRMDTNTEERARK